MSRLYSLVPLPQGPFAGLDPVTRMVFGLIYDRLRLSSHNLAGGKQHWYDPVEDREYCVFKQSELAELVGVSERTVRRSLELLRADNLVWWRKATYKGANRYYIHDGIMEYLRPRLSGQIVTAIRSD